MVGTRLGAVGGVAGPVMPGRGVGLARGATSVSGVGSFSVIDSSPSGFLRRNIMDPLHVDLM